MTLNIQSRRNEVYSIPKTPKISKKLFQFNQLLKDLLSNAFMI